MTFDFDPDWVIPPGDTIAECCDEHGFTHEQVASRMAIKIEEFEALIRGERELTTKMAMQLEIMFGVSIAFWVNLEKSYRDGLAAGKKVP